jgi:uncharacterized RDD family membrane protein YckC
MAYKAASANNGVPSVWRRLKALLIDYFIILVWMGIVGIVGFIFSRFTGGYPDYLGAFGPFGTQALFFLILTLPIGLYIFITESGAEQATFGKQKVAIKVVNDRGDPPSRSSIATRTIVKLLPWEVSHTLVWQMQYVSYKEGYDAEVPAWIIIGLCMAMAAVLVYVAMIAIRRDGKAPHDIVAGTEVVNK